MTRQRLFEIVKEYNLVLAMERVTTGPVNGESFRTFEFVADNENSNLTRAAIQIRQEWGVSADFCQVRNSDYNGERYLEISSFWCGPELTSNKV